MSRTLWLALCVQPWTSLILEAQHRRIPYRVTNEVRSYGFAEVFESREAAEQAYPRAAILKLEVPLQDEEGEACVS